MLKIAFRCDASIQIGSGHFMRCLTLADTLKKQGALIRFVSRNLPDCLRDMLVAKGMEFAALKSERSETCAGDLRHSHWLGTSQLQDVKSTIQALTDQTWDWLVVDHYALDARWESGMRIQAKHIMVIDDIADRQHDCDVLLDQNFYEDMQARYTGKVPVDCRLLLGPRYALLRDEFWQLREHIKPRTGPVKRIMVFFGGVDADNYTGLAIKALSGLGIKGIHVDIVIGAVHPERIQIEKDCAIQGYACHVQTTHMAELMAAADLAIGAGGSACWERCCLGLPALSICVADNQCKQISNAANAGLLYAPSCDGDMVELIWHHTKALFENSSLLNLISVSALNTVDGKGVFRVAGILDMKCIEMKLATEDDSQKLFEWRNHPSIRSVSRNNDLIAWNVHCSWFASILSDKDRTLLVGYLENKPVGVVRFDKDGDVVEVSIYLVPEGGYTRQGRNLLLSAERWLQANRLGIKRIRATVLNENSASHRLFSGADYQLEMVTYMKEV
jgi:UDP-2,4-diacetamido-2,4,6-trideoxy-beta-L-altropyranose hydrolase